MPRLSLHWLVTLALIRMKSINFIPADLIRNVISRLIDFQMNHFVVDVRKKCTHIHARPSQPIKLLSYHSHNLITCLFGLIAACSEWERENAKHIFTSAFMWSCLNTNTLHFTCGCNTSIDQALHVPEFHASYSVLVPSAFSPIDLSLTVKRMLAPDG